MAGSSGSTSGRGERPSWRPDWIKRSRLRGQRRGPRGGPSGRRGRPWIVGWPSWAGWRWPRRRPPWRLLATTGTAGSGGDDVDEQPKPLAVPERPKALSPAKQQALTDLLTRAAAGDES